MTFVTATVGLAFLMGVFAWGAGIHVDIRQRVERPLATFRRLGTK
jgi:hypothetical protein